MGNVHLPVTPAQAAAAEKHIQDAIDQADAAVELTAKGCLAHVLLSLGIILEVAETSTSCGHPAFGKAAGAYRCGLMSCENYYMRHWTKGKK
jgi:hypothetical protein